MRKVVPKSLQKSLEGIEGPSSFWDWDRVSLSPFVNLSTVMGVSMGVSKPQTADRRPQTADRRPQTADRSSHLKLQNEDLRQNALLDAKHWIRWGIRFVVLPISNYKTKTLAETFYLTLKHWNQWGLRFVVLPASNYKTKTVSKMPVSIL